MTADQLEVIAVKGEQIRPKSAGAQREEDVVQHLLNSGFLSAVLARDSSNQLARLFPVFERRGDDSAGSFERSDVPFDQADSTGIDRSSVRLFDHHRVEEHRHLVLPVDVHKAPPAVAQQVTEGEPRPPY